MASRNPRTISPTKSNRMNELYKLIESGNSELLQDELNMHKLRQTFSTGRDTTNVSTSGGSPRRSKKYSVDDSGMVRNSRLANGVHPDNTNNDSKNLIKGSLDSLFGNNSNQYERSHGEHWDRDPRKFRL